MKQLVKISRGALGGDMIVTKGCISEVYFGYNTILEVYPHFTADINELSEISLDYNKGALIWK